MIETCQVVQEVGATCDCKQHHPKLCSTDFASAYNFYEQLHIKGFIAKIDGLLQHLHILTAFNF